MSSPRGPSALSLASFVVVFVAPLAVVFGLPHLVAVPPSTTYGQFAQYVKHAAPVGFSAAYVPPERLGLHVGLAGPEMADAADTGHRFEEFAAEDTSVAPDSGRSAVPLPDTARFADRATPRVGPATSQRRPPRSSDASRRSLRRVSFHAAAGDSSAVPTDGDKHGTSADPGNVESDRAPRPYRRTGALGTSLGLEPVATPLTWSEAVRELKRLGIEDFHLERGAHQGEFIFWCHYTPPDEPKSNYRFAAEGYHPLQAIAQVLREIRALNQRRNPAPALR